MRYTFEDLKELQKLYVAERDTANGEYDYGWRNADDWYISGKDAFVGMTDDFIEWLEQRG